MSGVRLMGLDVGARKIGVALSDELGITAQPHGVVEAGPGKPDPFAQLVSICKEQQVNKVVIGLPLSMGGGDRGSSSRRAYALGERFDEELGMAVAYWDERFTTAEAERLLISADLKRKQRKQVVDKVAAALILQGYLDAG